MAGVLQTHSDLGPAWLPIYGNTTAFLRGYDSGGRVCRAWLSTTPYPLRSSLRRTGRRRLTPRVTWRACYRRTPTSVQSGRSPAVPRRHFWRGYDSGVRADLAWLSTAPDPLRSSLRRTGRRRLTLVGGVSWGPDPCARRLAGSPHLTSPLLSLREPTGGNSLGRPGGQGD